MPISQPENLYPIDRLRLRSDFDRAARSYDQCADLQRMVAAHVYRDAKMVIPKDNLVLDAGAGTGFIADFSEKDGHIWDLVQLDISESMCVAARNKHRNIPVVVGDMMQLPFADESFGGVVSSLALQWVEHTGLFFKEMFRILKPGASFMVSSFGPASLRELRHSMMQAEGSPYRLNPFYMTEHLRNDAYRAGFGALYSHSEMHVRYYPDSYAIMHEMRAVGGGNKFSKRPKHFTPRKYFERTQRFYEMSFAGANGLPATWELQFLCARKPENV